VFSSKRRITGRHRSLFDGDALVDVLTPDLGDRTLGDPSITTGLCIITKRADTRSIWPLHNHPDGRFYQANHGIPLTTAIRASAAAPFYFTPVGIDVGAGGGIGAFIDGAVSMANNPALLLARISTIEGYAFRWPTGAADLLVTSVGTGTWSKRRSAATVLNHRLWDWAIEAPLMLMEDAVEHTDIMMRWLGTTPTPRVVDLESGDLTGDLPAGDPLFTYQRYDAPLDRAGLEAIGRSDLIPQLDSLRKVAAGGNVGALLEIGRLMAAADVHSGHFPPAFDLTHAGGAGG
jgi:hypothetical protein